VKRRELADHRPGQRAGLLHVADQRQTREALQPNHFGDVVDVLLLDEEFPQGVPGGGLDLRGLRDLGFVDRHRQGHLADADAYHRELVAARRAVPHPHRPGDTHQLIGFPMEMVAVVPLLAALDVDLVADLVKPGEPGAAEQRQLAPRHPLRGPAAAEQHADHADQHHDAEDAEAGSEAAHAGDIHRDDEADDTDHQGDRQHDAPHAARRRDRRRDRRVDRDLAAGGGRGPAGFARTHERLSRHEITLTALGSTHRHPFVGSLYQPPVTRILGRLISAIGPS
jgi:hypothetical protein